MRWSWLWLIAVSACAGAAHPSSRQATEPASLAGLPSRVYILDEESRLYLGTGSVDAAGAHYTPRPLPLWARWGPDPNGSYDRLPAQTRIELVYLGPLDADSGLATGSFIIQADPQRRQVLFEAPVALRPMSAEGIAELGGRERERTILDYAHPVPAAASEWDARRFDEIAAPLPAEGRQSLPPRP